MASSETRARAKEIFLDLLDEGDADEADPGAGPALEERCGGDEALRAEVERLLRAHAGADRRFPKSLTGGAVPVRMLVAPPGPGDRVGPYRLLRLLGEGGFGVVFLAQQEAPIVRRVALKLVLPGRGGDQVVKRFEAERQALAMMSHPGIADVHDAGTTEQGAPYFVMEYVDGEPITEFCDARRLALRARLELFVEVCLAVQHAHQKGVVHRDLKPQNVLVAEVDGRPAPKVIDFGIAKAFGDAAPLLGQTLTSGSQVLGTPAFMAPEQAAGPDGAVDTRTDVYSLGVLLYHLLTGDSPYELSTGGLVEWVDAIRERTPARPSTRFDRLGDEACERARARGADPAALRRDLAGELDWIVMRAIEKEPRDRYPTADALAADVRRHLADEPVEAGPPGRVYRLRKLVQRHRVAVAALFAVLFTMAAATLVSGVSAWVAIRSRNDTAAALELAEQRAYTASMSAAQAALEGNDADLARKLLDAAPAGRRGWEWAYFEGCLDDGELVLRGGGEGKASFVLYHPDGSRLAYDWSVGGTIHVADARTGAELARWTPHEPERLQALVAAPDGSSLYSAARSGGVARWSWNGALEQRYEGAAGRVSSLAPCRDGRLHATTADGALLSWSAAGELEASARLEVGVRVAAVSPDGRAAAVGTEDERLRTFALPGWRPLAELDASRGPGARRDLRRPSGEVTALAYSPDSARLLTGARDGLVALWDARTGERLWSFEDHRAWIWDVAWSPDGTRFAAGSYDGTGTLFDAASRELVLFVTAHRFDVRNVGFTLDSRHFLTSSWDKSVKVFDARDGQLRTTLLGHADLARGFALTPADATRFATWAEDSTVRTWSLRAGLLETLPRAGYQVMKAHLLDDTTLLTTGLEHESRVWDLSQSPPGFRVLDGADDARRCTSLRAGRLALALPGELQVRDARALDVTLRVPWDRPEAPLGVALSPDAERVVVGWGDGGLLLLDARTGERLGACALPDGLAHLAFDERGPLAASGTRVYGWPDPGAGPRLALDLGATIRCFARSPDGRLLAVGMEDRRVLLLDARDLSTRAELSGHGGALNDLRWLPDGSRLASCATDRTVRLWDPATAELVATLRGHDGNVYSLEVSADGRDLYSCSNDETVRRWRGSASAP